MSAAQPGWTGTSGAVARGDGPKLTRAGVIGTGEGAANNVADYAGPPAGLLVLEVVRSR